MGEAAAKQGDFIIATDTHIILMPSPAGPVPTPTLLPFSGTLSINLSPTVWIMGRQAAALDSGAINQPLHVPPGGTFSRFPTNVGRIQAGSSTVFINGRPAARNDDPAITCNDPFDAVVGHVAAAGSVFIG